MSRAVLFDTETTGLDPLTGHRVIEIAAVELLRELPTGRHFHTLIHPERDIPDEVVRVHGITLDRVAAAPRFAAIVDELLEFLGDGPLIAHNAPFDFAFLDAELARLGRSALGRSRMVDTLELARTRFPGLPNSLDALCRRFDIDLSARTTHHALLDCRLLAEVYVELTGGRQRGLWANDPAPPRPVAALAGAVPAGPVVRSVRPIVPTPAELDAHARLVARLAEPLWAIA